MKAGRYLVWVGSVTLAVIWAAAVSIRWWAPLFSPTEKDLGLGILAVGVFALAHVAGAVCCGVGAVLLVRAGFRGGFSGPLVAHACWGFLVALLAAAYLTIFVGRS